MIKSIEHSYQGPREVRPLVMTAEDAADYQALGMIGIQLPPAQVAAMANAIAMDDQQGGVTTPSVAVPVQFLQTMLPGFVRTLTAARKCDELMGLNTVGSWEDEEIVQGVLEPIGGAVPYGDYTNVPLASWNTNFERRTVVRFEQGIKVAKLESARAARVRVDSAAEKRSAAALALEIQRNLVAHVGYNSGNNRTYGFLNDPSLPAYVTVATGAASSTTWAQKTYLEIIADIKSAFATLQQQTQDNVSMDSKMTLAVATAVAAHLTTPSAYGGDSPKGWLERNMPNTRIVSDPQLSGANGGANVFYLYAEEVDDGASDDSRTWAQIVPAKFVTTGVENGAKGYVESYTSATAGVLLKRPYAVVRRSGV